MTTFARLLPPVSTTTAVPYVPTRILPPKTTDVLALPADIASNPVRAGDEYGMHLTLRNEFSDPVADGRNDASPYLGLARDLDRADDVEYTPPIRQVADGANLTRAISAAAKFSHEVDAHAGWNPAAESSSAVGVFQAQSGTFYLGSMHWASDQNEDGSPLTLTPGNQIDSFSPQLKAVVSDTAIAHFDSA